MAIRELEVRVIAEEGYEGIAEVIDKGEEREESAPIEEIGKSRRKGVDVR